MPFDLVATKPLHWFGCLRFKTSLSCIGFSAAPLTGLLKLFRSVRKYLKENFGPCAMSLYAWNAEKFSAS